MNCSVNTSLNAFPHVLLLLLSPWTLRVLNARMRASTNRLWTCPLAPPRAVYLTLSNYHKLAHQTLGSLYLFSPPSVFIHVLNTQFTSSIIEPCFRYNTITTQVVFVATNGEAWGNVFNHFFRVMIMMFCHCLASLSRSLSLYHWSSMIYIQKWESGNLLQFKIVKQYLQSRNQFPPNGTRERGWRERERVREREAGD